MKLVLATHNDGKTVEMQHALSYLPVEVLTLKHFPQIGDIPETGSTLLENAFIKAETVYRETGIPSLADDTGLEIKALGGEPGVFSARYAGEQATFDDNCNKVLSKLTQAGTSDRSACFRTVIAFVNGAEKLHCEGSVDGEIIDKKITYFVQSSTEKKIVPNFLINKNRSFISLWIVKSAKYIFTLIFSLTL